MREYQVNPDIRKIWKIYPVRIQGHSTSPCHKQETLLVHSMERGFVRRNCPECGETTTLPEHVFFNKLDLWVSCPECKARMEKQKVGVDYAFVCPKCDLYIKLAELLPRYYDL